MLTSRAETANSIATRICRRTGKYSRSIREPGLKANSLLSFGLPYASEMTILLSNRIGQSRRQALVLLAILFDRASCHEILQFLVSSKPQHFFAAACSVPGAKVLVHDVEKLLKLKGRASG